MNAVIPNATDHRPLFHFKNDDLGACTIGRVFNAQLHVFKELRIPESLEVTAQCLFIICVAFAAEDAGLQRVVSNPAIADELNPLDDKGSALRVLRCCFLKVVFSF